MKILHTLISLSIILGVLLGVCSSSLYAEDLLPEEVKVSTPRYHANLELFRPRLGTYAYDVTWQGIGAARCWINVSRKGDHYLVTALAKTNSVVSLLYRLDYHAQGLITADAFTPVATYLEQTENSTKKTAQVKFLPGGVVETVRKKNDEDAQEHTFTVQNFMLDPFSAAFLARSMDWEVGQSRSFDTFNAKARYLLTFTAIDKTTLQVNGKARPVFVISPKVEKLTSPHAKQKLREARIYVTADEYRDILRIESEVFVGSVKTELKSFEAPSLPKGKSAKVAHNAIINYEIR